MKQIIKTTVLLLLAIYTQQAAMAQPKKILVVSTNIDSLENEANGTFLMEIAYPLDTLRKMGIEADIVTPLGGRAAIYHRGNMPGSLSAIAGSDFFVQKINNSLSPAQVNPADYSAVFYPGGGGQFYDVVNNEKIAGIAAAIYENGGMIGVAGHGAVSLIHIKLADGSYLVQHKKITCFPKVISAKWLPVNWEAMLAQRGATVVLPVTAAEKENGVQLLDGRIVSGSYAENAAWVAAQLAAGAAR